MRHRQGVALDGEGADRVRRSVFARGDAGGKRPAIRQGDLDIDLFHREVPAFTDDIHVEGLQTAQIEVA